MTLNDYEELLLDKKCRWCNTDLVNSIDHYEHQGGYEVEGFAEKQWLYTECPKCKYQWALGKII